MKPSSVTSGEAAALMRFELSPPEAVERFRETAREALETEGELSPALRAALAVRARASGVHPYDEAATLRDVRELPSVLAAFEAARGRRFEGARLEASVDAAPLGGEVVLERGTYRLDAPLVLRRAITLRGEGPDRTRVVCASRECVLRLEGQGPVVVRGISFEHEGELAADVVVVSGGAARLEGCRFSGGAADSLGVRGHGVAVSSPGPVEVVSCSAVGNRRTGILVREDARAYVRDCHAGGNGGSGIGFHAGAGGSAEANTCERNDVHGIACAGSAEVSLDRNDCLGNERAGIDLSGGAACTARANTCTGNGRDGIRVSGDARAVLVENRCASNRGAGIGFGEGAGGEGRGNRCLANQRHGISVERRASPVLEANTCEKNRAAGIGFQGSARGTARANACRENLGDGILVDGHARPVLEENECLRNHDSGIRWAGCSGGRARANRCESNRYYGIAIGKRAHPDPGTDNQCRDNGFADVFDARGASGP